MYFFVVSLKDQREQAQLQDQRPAVGEQLADSKRNAIGVNSTDEDKRGEQQGKQKSSERRGAGIKPTRKDESVEDKHLYYQREEESGPNDLKHGALSFVSCVVKHGANKLDARDPEPIHQDSVRTFDQHVQMVILG